MDFLFILISSVTRNLPYTLKILCLRKYLNKFLNKCNRKEINIAYDKSMKIAVNIGEEIGSHIALFGYHHYEKSMFISQYIKKDYICIDIGANIGEVTLLLGKYGKEVHSFEPMKDLLKKLSHNISINSLTNVTVNNTALTNKIGTVDFFGPDTDVKNDGLFSLQKLKGHKKICTVSTDTLDRYVEQQKLLRIDFIKIDIEGSALFCLQGASKVLEKFKPLLLLEINHQTFNSFGYSSQDLIEFLQSVGYKNFFLPHIGGGLKITTKDEIVSMPNSFNIIAIA